MILLQAWDTNSENGQYLTGLEAQRKIVEGMRKKVETMKTLMTPAFSNPAPSGSIFSFPGGGSKAEQQAGQAPPMELGGVVGMDQQDC